MCCKEFRCSRGFRRAVPSQEAIQSFFVLAIIETCFLVTESSRISVLLVRLRWLAFLYHRRWLRFRFRRCGHLGVPMSLLVVDDVHTTKLTSKAILFHFDEFVAFRRLQDQQRIAFLSCLCCAKHRGRVEQLIVVNLAWMDHKRDVNLAIVNCKHKRGKLTFFAEANCLNFETAISCTSNFS